MLNGSKSNTTTSDESLAVAIVRNLTVQNEIALMYLFDFASYHFAQHISNISFNDKPPYKSVAFQPFMKSDQDLQQIISTYHQNDAIKHHKHSKQDKSHQEKSKFKHKSNIVLSEYIIASMKQKKAEDIHIFFILTPMRDDLSGGKERSINVHHAEQKDSKIRHFDAIYWTDWELIKVTLE